MQIIETIPKLKPRAVDAHKGTFGKVCIVAGSVGMSGAAALAGRAALRVGAGLVRVATASSVQPVVAAIEPSYTTIPLPKITPAEYPQRQSMPSLMPLPKMIVWPLGRVSVSVEACSQSFRHSSNSSSCV